LNIRVVLKQYHSKRKKAI
jgi:serine/threonine protein kinase